MDQTFAIIKPDAVSRGLTGKILALIEEKGFRIRAMRMAHLSTAEAEGFYAVHKGKGFFAELIEFMISGPCVVLCLEKDNAVEEWRNLMGTTDPVNADPGTIRKLYAESIGRNCVHGSDAKETAATELAYFFRSFEIQ
jgi:nucleoside-diphosphate kinase